MNATLAVQYLENTPDVAAIAPGDARAKLHAAFEILPIAYVFMGWNLPEPLFSACREEVKQTGAQLLRWHPLLTGDGDFVPRPEWQTVGLQGEAVPGFQGLPEFTFVCPNRPTAREAVLNHLHQVLQRGDYDGVFLDRIRYPSPAADLTRWLACFCDDCCGAASKVGLDLEAVQRRIGQMLAAPECSQFLIQALLGPKASESPDPDVDLLDAFFDFRARSISSLVQTAADLIHAQGLTVALDCFSPSLARMVGQDLGDLDACGEWTKVMTYGHALGPAGLPFELLELADWLIERQGLSEARALEWLSRVTGLSLPHSRAALRAHGLAPSALLAEIRKARAAGVSRLLAGIELVELEGIACLNREQIEEDLRAFYRAGADGLVLSWDLWHIPLERLRLVSLVWPR